MPQGSVKHYDVNERTDTIEADNGVTQWPIDPVARDQGMFRFFRSGERVTFDVVEEDDVARVRNLRIAIA